jgi:hypothetical protein
MRVMEIPPYPRKVEIADLDNLVRARLSQTVVMWPEQAIPLLGYMCCPNDPQARGPLLRMLRTWQEGSEKYRPAILRKLSRIQHDWLRVADIFHVYRDLVAGQHQERRGGPSIGKAITLVAANTKSWGTGDATLWKNWSTYKDVAHVVAATTLICSQARAMFSQKPFGPFGLSEDQLLPFQMALLMPDLAIAAALDFERLGLSVVPHALEEPTLDPETVWRIPPDINVAPLPPVVRKIRSPDLVVLNNRRAGNRGKAKTTPISR